MPTPKQFKQIRITVIVALLIAHWSLTHAQCPLTVSAGPDQTACAPSGTVTLNGSVTGTALGFNWDPITGLDDPTSLTPNANVTGDQTYTLTAAAEDPTAPNLVINPAFELGNTGFTSDFSYTSTPITPGTYYLTTSPQVVNSNFPPCDDHTFGNGTGYMMLVNGTGNAGAQVWCQTIPISPNTWYSMSAWASASPISPPELQFSVNGVLIGSPFPVQPGVCVWQQFSAGWYSGSAGSVELCITDQNNSGNGLFGDDFVLDDIYFGEACTVSDEMMVSLVDIMAVLDPVVELLCSDLPAGLVLDGSGSSSGANISYSWMTSDGNIISGANTATPTINLEGTYTLTVTYDDGIAFCTDQATIQVLPDPNVVFAIIAPAEELNCNSPTITLNAAPSSSGPTISYSWSPMTGIVSGGDTQFPVVNMGGSYTLLVSNSISGCTAMETVFVFENFIEPIVNVEEAEDLTCADTIVTLDGTGSSTGSEFSYLWTTSDGSIVSGETTIDDCMVDSAGIYTLTVSNSTNGCTADTLVIVMADIDAPTAIANAPDDLECGASAVDLDGTGSSTGGSISYLWTTVDGNILSGETTLEPTVDAEGEYLLTVSDSDSGCSASDTTFVEENTATIIVDIELPDTVNCFFPSIQLDATGSSQGADLSYLWTTGDGNLTAGDTTLTPTVNAPGSYLLTITDGPTGCTAVDSVMVQENTTQPISEAGPNATIDCDADPVTLNGTGSSAGPGFSLEWTTNGGNFTAGETTLMPEVNAAGTYVLTITDQSNGCTAVDSTEVNQTGAAPEVVLIVDVVLDCSLDTLTIDGSGSTSGPQILIEWSTMDGNFAGGETTLNPQVNGAGTYTLTLTDQSSGCVGSGSVIVEIDTLAPTAILAVPPDLNCDSLTVHLDATASMGPGLFAVSWNYLGGSGGIVNGANTLTPEVDSPGNYVLTLVSWDNSCVVTDTAEVFQNITPPNAEAGAAQMLTCDIAAISLDGDGSSVGANFSYLWTTMDGSLASGETTLTPEVNGAGTYLLTVTDTLNGCTASDDVMVSESADLPQVEALPADSLTCEIDEISLSANASTGANFIYLWTTMDGNLASGETTLTPSIDAPGTYLLTVTDTLNGCMATDEVTVIQNGDLPMAVAGQPFDLSCNVTNAMLDGSGSTSGAGISYLWTTSNGNILSDETTLSPTINAAGTYLLTVTDQANGCTATDEVIIGQDAAAPLADAGLPDTLTCILAALNLDGTGSSQGATLTYEWTTSDGNIVAGNTTLTPDVDAAGTYLLTVTDMSNSCQSIASVTIADVTDGPAITVTDTVTLTCIDTMLSLSATVSGMPDLLWTTADGEILSGEMTLTPTIGAAGSYLLTATDMGSGCSSMMEVNVGEDVTPPSANVAVSENITCAEPTVIIDGTGSSSGLDFSFIWETLGGNFAAGQSTLQPSVDAPGSYILTVTNDANGCTAIASEMVVVDTLAPMAIAAAPQQLGCDVQQVELDGMGSTSGLLIEYLWTTIDGNIVSGETTLTPIVDAPGNYTLTVTNVQNGCTSQAEATVISDGNAPTALIAPPTELTCLETTVTLNASASTNGPDFEQNWTTLDGNFTAGQNTLTPTVDAPGTYVLIIENTANGCADTATVTVIQIADFPDAEAGAAAMLTCNEPEIALAGSSTTLDVDFAWATPNGNILFGADTPMPAVDASGIYFLTVTNSSNGCTSVDSVEVLSSAIESFQFESTDASCVSGLGSLTFQSVQGSGTIGLVGYSIDGGVSFSMENYFPDLPTGTYDLVVQDSGGCILNDVAVITEPIGVEVSLPQIATLDLGESYQLTPMLNLPANEISEAIWSPLEGLSCTDCLAPTATPNGGISYTLIVTDVNGCTAEASITFNLQSQDGGVYVPNAFSPNGDGVNDRLVVFANPAVVKEVQRFLIFTRWGESVFENYNFPPSTFEHGWDGTHRGQILGSGVYVWFAEVELTNGEVQFLEGEVSILK